MASPAAPVSEIEVRRVQSLVRLHYGFDTLRPGQGETLVRTLRGESLLAVLPTGAGKSLCYQLPVLHETEGLTLVVSPLIALMKDQLDAMPDALRAVSVALTPGTGKWDSEILQEIREGRHRLVYAAPERLRSAPFLEALKARGVTRLVVDEAHCVSTWGHDFRPDYLYLPEVRKALGNPPLLAMTATAPPRVRDDVLARFGAMAVVRVPVHRPNLRLETILCRNADEKLGHLITLCRETPGPGVIYASSRDKTEQIAAALKARGLNAEAYHAGLPDRSERQDAFMRGDIHVLVATVAFGMGVDKGDIRFIFHHDPSTSLEAYAQEAGRAGRDGKPSRCVLLATNADGSAIARKAKSDLPDPSLVGALEAKLRDWATPNGWVALPREALPDDPDEEVKARVALSLLEAAGSVERYPDVPHAFMLRVFHGPLKGHGGRSLSPFELAALLDVPPPEVEPALIAARERGELQFQGAERHLLLRLTGKPPEVEARLKASSKLAEERAEEMMAYVTTPGCLHAHLAKHMGDPPGATPCGACDRCLKIGHTIATDLVPDDAASLRIALEVLAGVKGIGEANLVKTLRGDPDVPNWCYESPHYGRLGLRSAAKLKGLVAELRQRGLAEQETLSHGGVTLRITDKGRDRLASGEPLEVAAAPPPAPARAAAPRRSPEPEEEAPLTPEEERLFEILRAWRRERSDELGVPPYVVAADKTLRALARARPRTEADLLAVKGIGPKKVEEFGRELLDLFRRVSG